MRFRALACWAAMCAAQLLAACDRQTAPDALSNAIATAQPFASKLTSYETWALRAISVSQPSASNTALAEALFAPIRNDHTVLAAWITLPSRQAGELSFPPKLTKPDPRTWTQVRDPALGWIRVARHARCPIALPKAWRNGVERCVLLARDPDHQPASTPMIALAFVDPSR